MNINPYKNQKYRFDEIVIVHSENPSLCHLNGLEGYINSKISPEDYTPGDAPTIVYGVRFEGMRDGWCIPEDDLLYTGKFINPDKNGA